MNFEICTPLTFVFFCRIAAASGFNHEYCEEWESDPNSLALGDLTVSPN